MKKESNNSYAYIAIVAIVAIVAVVVLLGGHGMTKKVPAQESAVVQGANGGGHATFAHRNSVSIGSSGDIVFESNRCAGMVSETCDETTSCCGKTAGCCARLAKEL